LPKIHKEVTVLKDENLLGNNQLKLTNCKGGKVRVIELPPELYQKVNEIVQREGVFSFLYRTYMSDLKTAALETNQQFQGSHGLRWCYSQRAFKEAQENGASYEDALKQVSTSLGHCRKTITLHYLK
jgi:integrase